MDEAARPRRGRHLTCTAAAGEPARHAAHEPARAGTSRDHQGRTVPALAASARRDGQCPPGAPAWRDARRAPRRRGGRAGARRAPHGDVERHVRPHQRLGWGAASTDTSSASSSGGGSVDVRVRRAVEPILPVLRGGRWRMAPGAGRAAELRLVRVERPAGARRAMPGRMTCGARPPGRRRQRPLAPHAGGAPHADVGTGTARVRRRGGRPVRAPGEVPAVPGIADHPRVGRRCRQPVLALSHAAPMVYGGRAGGRASSSPPAVVERVNAARAQLAPAGRPWRRRRGSGEHEGSGRWRDGGARADPGTRRRPVTNPSRRP